MPPISATIITYNEAKNIARAIRSLHAADEIIVVDSGSTDGTQSIASKLGARVVENPWPGFAAQKQHAVTLARHDWILSLDADEEFDDTAQSAIQQWKSSEPSAAGYRFVRKAFYIGRWILHSGWYPDPKIRLFDRRRGDWKGDFVHESVVVDGPVEWLGGEILHYTCDSLEDHRARIEFYTDLAAQEMALRGRSFATVRRILGPPWVFFSSYFLRLGILDGRQGYWIARMAARYVERKYSKWALIRKRQSVKDSVSADQPPSQK